MAISNEQLRAIHQDLEAGFGTHQYIRVIPLDGDPPGKYEIRYSVPGLVQDGEGNVIQAGEHIVFIEIPFGFPHFPPSCTPQTRTFHPDFDQAAVCIGQFWNKDRTLAELIIHIGGMISGEIYSRENVFNDAALAWYRKISGKLPFEEIDFSSQPEADTIHSGDAGDDGAVGEWAGEETADDAPAQTKLLQQELSHEKSGKRVAFFEEKTRTSIKFLPLLGGIIALALAGVFITPLFSATSQLEKSGRLYSDCLKMMDQGRFDKARTACEEALSTIKKINIYKKDECEALLKEIKLTLASEEMIQGLSGRVFLNGKYVRKADMARISEFNALKEEADMLYADSLWLDAVNAYAAALKNAGPVLKNIEEDRLTEISDRIRIAKIHISAEKGSSLMSKGELKKSHEIYASALNEAGTLPEGIGRSLVAMLETKLHEIEYLQHLSLAEKYFKTDDWESAVKQYEKALQLRSGSSLPSVHGDSLYVNMAEAELFSCIAGAQNAFSGAELDAALEKYQKAIDLLKSKEILLQRINPDETRQHLERIILQIRIVRFRQMADEHLQNENYDKAISTLEDAIAAVTSGHLQDEMEFRAIIEAIGRTIEDTRLKTTRARRIDYLTSNYREIFETNYSAAIPEYLSEPRAAFLRHIGKKELYELQCLEENRGRKLRLLMLYLYDPERETWQFYSNSD